MKILRSMDTNMKSLLAYEDARVVAYALLDAGFKPELSHGLEMEPTAGFGSICDYGYFKYPLDCYEDCYGMTVIRPEPEYAPMFEWDYENRYGKNQ